MFWCYIWCEMVFWVISRHIINETGISVICLILEKFYELLPFFFRSNSLHSRKSTLACQNQRDRNHFPIFLTFGTHYQALLKLTFREFTFSCPDHAGQCSTSFNLKIRSHKWRYSQASGLEVRFHNQFTVWLLPFKWIIDGRKWRSRAKFQ